LYQTQEETTETTAEIVIGKNQEAVACSYRCIWHLVCLASLLSRQLTAPLHFPSLFTLTFSTLFTGLQEKQKSKASFCIAGILLSK